jgi:hypothetical protein
MPILLFSLLEAIFAEPLSDSFFSLLLFFTLFFEEPFPLPTDRSERFASSKCEDLNWRVRTFRDFEIFAS